MTDHDSGCRQAVSWTRRFAAWRLALAAAACGAFLHNGSVAAEPKSPPPANPLVACELFPLTAGHEWTYKSGPLEVIERVTRHEKVGNELCARIETIYNGDVVAYEHVAVRKDGLYRVAISGKPVEPPLRFLKLPATKGSTWSVESAIVGQTVKGNFAISESSVTIGDKELPVVVVEGKDFTAGKSKLSFTYYFAPNVGKVKQVVVANGQETVLELTGLPHPAEPAAAPEVREL